MVWIWPGDEIPTPTLPSLNPPSNYTIHAQVSSDATDTYSRVVFSSGSMPRNFGGHLLSAVYIESPAPGSTVNTIDRSVCSA